MFGRNIRNKLPPFEEDTGPFSELDSRDKVMKGKIENHADKAGRVKEIDAFKPALETRFFVQQGIKTSYLLYGRTKFTK